MILQASSKVGELTNASRESATRLLNTPLFTLSQTPVTIITLFIFLFIIAVSWWLSHLARRGARRALTSRGHTDEATIVVSARLLQYIVLLLGVGVALQTIGLNLGALFTAGAFFAVALGFAMQNVAQNFVSGIILMTERTIKPGDILNVEGTVVRVLNIGMRATVARSRDNEDLIIPNATLVQTTVTNYTLRDSNYRIRTTVGVSYRSDLALVRDVLQKTADNMPTRVSDFPARILLTQFADSAVLFEISVWVSDPWVSRIIRSDLNEAIWIAFQQNGISIPFPQRDVHVFRVEPTLDP